MYNAVKLDVRGGFWVGEFGAQGLFTCFSGVFRAACRLLLFGKAAFCWLVWTKGCSDVWRYRVFDAALGGC